MKLSYTPGPWDWHGPYMTGGFKVSALDKDGHQTMQAFVDSADRATNEANARLIAAAPDLLAALHAIMLRAVRQQANGGGLHDFQDCSRACADTARAAIAKATGEGAK